MNEIISKELLSEVLGVGIRSSEVSPIMKCVYYVADNVSISSGSIINIYELAHKCKEWIINLDMEDFANIASGKNIKLDHKKEWYCSISFDLYDECYDVKSFYAKTEPEAIFKACQWILDNKETK